MGVSGLSWIGQGDKVLWKLKGFGVRDARVFHEWRGNNRLQALYMEIGNIARYDIQLMISNCNSLKCEDLIDF